MKIAFIGSAGVPNNYGGFEMFLDSCAPQLVEKFEEVVVTCDKSRYMDFGGWRGVTRVFIPIRANGGLSVLHDLVAFFSVFLRCRVIIVLGVSAGCFFPLFRMLCAVSGKRLVVNVDGVEWRRDKFSKNKRAFLYVSDRLAQFFSHRVIVDNEALRPFLIKKVQKDASLIAYPGDHVLKIKSYTNLSKNEAKFLTICRIEPENNCHLLLDAFSNSRHQGKYTFVGNWNASEYGRKLRDEYKDVPGLDLRDPTYDSNTLAILRENCTHYLHGHSVGGTNPSLVEMLFYDCQILAFDCAFNRATGGIAIEYFASKKELIDIIENCLDRKFSDRNEIRALYTRSKICDQYERMIYDLVEKQPLGADQKESDLSINKLIKNLDEL